MAKKQKQPTKTCTECIHESACRVWTGGRAISDVTASQCPSHETVKESGAYLCGVLDERKRKQTNADRIRAMNDEELMQFLFNEVSNNTICSFCVPTMRTKCKCDGHCKNGILKWLKQPAEVNENE